MRKLVEESHTKKAKKGKKKEFGEGSRAGSVQPKKKKPAGDLKVAALTDTVAASISNVVSSLLIDTTIVSPLGEGFRVCPCSITLE